MFFWKKKKKEKENPQWVPHTYEEVASSLRKLMVDEKIVDGFDFPDDSLLSDGLGIDSLEFILLENLVYLKFGVEFDIDKEGVSFGNIRFNQYVEIILKYLNDKKL